MEKALAQALMHGSASREGESNWMLLDAGYPCKLPTYLGCGTDRPPVTCRLCCSPAQSTCVTARATKLLSETCALQPGLDTGEPVRAANA